MKIQNTLRMKLIAIGFGAALLLAGSAHAQEIENTAWNDGPNVAPFAQQAPTATANNLQTAPPETQTLTLAAMSTTPLATQDASVTQWPPVEGWLFASLLISIALVAFYALAEAKRANRNIDARMVRVDN